MKGKKYFKVRDHCYYRGKYKIPLQHICNIKNSESKNIPIAFYNTSTYDYYFIITELV